MYKETNPVFLRSSRLSHRKNRVRWGDQRPPGYCPRSGHGISAPLGAREPLVLPRALEASPCAYFGGVVLSGGGGGLVLDGGVVWSAGGGMVVVEPGAVD